MGANTSLLLQKRKVQEGNRRVAWGLRSILIAGVCAWSRFPLKW